MQTYDSYLERVLALPLEDAAHIFTTIKKNIEKDAEMTGLYHALLSRSIEYATVRAEWQMMETDEKGAIDKRRSEIHDAVIREFGILARNPEGSVTTPAGVTSSATRRRTPTTGNALATWPATSYCSRA